MEMAPSFFALQGMVMLLSLISLIFVNPFIQGGIISVTYNHTMGRSVNIHDSLNATRKGLKLVPTSLSPQYFIGVGIVLVILTIILLVPWS